MNPDDIDNDLPSITIDTYDPNSYLTTTGIATITSSNIVGSSITTTNADYIIENVLDKYELNQVIIEHKLQEQELLKLKDVSDWQDHIKKNLTSQLTERIMQKVSFTKQKNVDTDTTTFRGKVWVFTKSDLEDLIKECCNVS